MAYQAQISRRNPSCFREPDGAGGIVEVPTRFPIWFEPRAQRGTSTCGALRKADELLREWTRAYPASLPPTVFHITDGEATDGRPVGPAAALRDTGTSYGRTLLDNIHISDRQGAELAFPASAEAVADPHGRVLFEMSSELPDALRERRDDGRCLPQGARGFLFNADPVAVIHFLDIGTRPANLQVLCDQHVVPEGDAEVAEDAAAWSRVCDGAPFRAAVADGASEAAFSGLWARLLVDAHVAGRLEHRSFRADLRPLREAWRQLATRRRPPRYAEAHVARGASAAFVGLSLGVRGGRPWWQAAAAGDSCLSLVHADRLELAFPVTTAAALSGPPTPLGSRQRGAADDRVVRKGGRWEVDDVFLLMTDALAGWFLREHEAGRTPWRTLLDLDARDGPAFAEGIARQRALRAVRDDDVALLRVQVAGGI